MFANILLNILRIVNKLSNRLIVSVYAHVLIRLVYVVFLFNEFVLDLVHLVDLTFVEVRPLNVVLVEMLSVADEPVLVHLAVLDVWVDVAGMAMSLA